MDCEADIGTWDKGITLKFKAKDEKAAIAKAVKLKERAIEKGKISGPTFVVQVGEKTDSPGVRRIFYDYMNGHMTRNKD